MAAEEKVEDRIRSKLADAFAPTRLEVVNESHRHAGHAGSPGTGESHFNVALTSSAFEGLGRVARQRAVYDVLSAELAGPVHALSLALKTPSEDG